MDGHGPEEQEEQGAEVGCENGAGKLRYFVSGKKREGDGQRAEREGQSDQEQGKGKTRFDARPDQ